MWKPDKTLEALEAQGLWDEALGYVWENYEAHPDDPIALCRAAGQMFYSLLFFKEMGIRVELTDAGEQLAEYRRIGEEKFKNNADVLSVFGYIWELSPWFYPDFEGTSEEADAIARGMYQKALLKDIRCALAPVLNFPHDPGERPNPPEYFRVALREYLPGNSAFEQFLKKALA